MQENFVVLSCSALYNKSAPVLRMYGNGLHLYEAVVAFTGDIPDREISASIVDGLVNVYVRLGLFTVDLVKDSIYCLSLGNVTS